MVNVLPEVRATRQPGIGERLARAFNNLGEAAGQSFADNQKINQRNQLINQIEGRNSNSISEEFKNVLPEIEKKLGFKLNEDQARSVANQLKGESSQSQNSESDPFLKSKMYAAAGEHDLSRVSAEETQFQQKIKSEKAQRHYDIAKKTLESTAEKAEGLPQKEAALENMIAAIENNDLSFFSKDNLAELTGIEGLRSAEGAVFKSSAKEFLLGSLKRAGARPNQWIEQQIESMLTKIGRSTEANLSVAEALKTELDVDKKQIELTNSMADQLEKDLGYVPRDLADRVRKQLTPYANEQQKILQEKLMSIKDMYEPINKSGYLMYDPKGTLRRVSKKEVPEATKEGYRLYK